MTPDREILGRTRSGELMRVARYGERVYVNGLRAALVVLKDNVLLRVVVQTRRGERRHTYRLSTDLYDTLMRSDEAFI